MCLHWSVLGIMCLERLRDGHLGFRQRFVDVPNVDVQMRCNVMRRIIGTLWILGMHDRSSRLHGILGVKNSRLFLEAHLDKPERLFCNILGVRKDSSHAVTYETHAFREHLVVVGGRLRPTLSSRRVERTRRVLPRQYEANPRQCLCSSGIDRGNNAIRDRTRQDLSMKTVRKITCCDIVRVHRGSTGQSVAINLVDGLADYMRRRVRPFGQVTETLSLDAHFLSPFRSCAAASRTASTCCSYPVQRQ